jgi:hypothetical protein
MDFFAWARLPMLRLWEEEADGKNPFSYEISFIVGRMSWVPQVKIEAPQTIIPKKRMTFFVRIHIKYVLLLDLHGSLI